MRHVEWSGSSCTQKWWIYLCTFQLLTTWCGRTREFLIPVLFALLWSNSFLPGAAYDLSIATACVLAMPRLGAKIVAPSRYGRYNIICSAIIAQKMFAFISFGAIYLLRDSSSWTFARGACFAGLLVSGASSELMYRASAVVVEKDWIPIMCESLLGQDQDVEQTAKWLASMNAGMRRVDLFCKLIVPLVLSSFLEMFDDDVKKIYIGLTLMVVFAFLSGVPQIWMMRGVYESFPVLSHDARDGSRRHSLRTTLLDDDGTDEGASLEGASTVNIFQRDGREIQFVSQRGVNVEDDERGFSITIYFRHTVFLASISYAMLYANALSGAGLMTQFLVTKNVRLIIIGVFHSLGAVFGIIGTVMWPRLRRACSGSLTRAGHLSVVSFAVMVAACVLVFVPGAANDTICVYAMMIIVAVSRCPLWMFDLMITQLLQDRVSSEERGLVCGSHVSAYTSFGMLMNILTIVFHNPNQFHILAYISVGFLLGAALLYSLWTLSSSKALVDNCVLRQTNSSVEDSVVDNAEAETGLYVQMRRWCLATVTNDNHRPNLVS